MRYDRAGTGPPRMTSRWRAPRATSPVDAVVRLPGSKSMTNRALVIAALSRGESVIRNPLRSRDTELMAAALRALGADIDDSGLTWRVDAMPMRGGGRVDVGLAGTVARFVPPVAALAHGVTTFDGEPRMRERPIGPLVTALRELGVRVDAAPGGRLPITVHGDGAVAGGHVVVDASSSSQVVSALLLAAPEFADGLTVSHRGPALPSRPHVTMTLAMMRAAGARARGEADTWRVDPGGYRGRQWDVEPDLSGAAPFVAAAMVTGGRVHLPDWPRETTQAGAALVRIATEMGASCELDADGLTVVGADRARGADLDLRECSELAPTLAAVAVLADGPSRLHGIAHMRGHESDRLRALAGELSRSGARVEETDDGLVIDGAAGRLHGASLRAQGDHRLAMAYAVLGLLIDGVEVDDITTTAKTMPDFVERWTAMLGTPASSDGEA